MRVEPLKQRKTKTTQSMNNFFFLLSTQVVFLIDIVVEVCKHR